MLGSPLGLLTANVVEWGEQHAPWHFDHHMDNNPGANWCVTRPWFDYIIGTRVFTAGGLREDNVLGMKKFPHGLSVCCRKLNRWALLQQNRQHGAQLKLCDIINSQHTRGIEWA